MSRRWPDEAAIVAFGLWAEGLSGEDIAIILERELGYVTTRSAVMGKLNRAGVLGRKRGPSPCRGVKRAEFAQAWARWTPRARSRAARRAA